MVCHRSMDKRHINPEHQIKRTAPKLEQPYTSLPVAVVDTKPIHHDVEHRKLTQDILEQRASNLLDVLESYLSAGNYQAFKDKIEKANLQQVGIFQGILIDKMLTLRGQPSSIVGYQEQASLDQLMPALLEEMKRRGLKATATERKVEIIAI